MAFVFFDLSEPARSMMWKRDVFMFQTPVYERDFDSMMVVRTECDRELSLFIEVEPTCLFLAPLKVSAIMSL